MVSDHKDQDKKRLKLSIFMIKDGALGDYDDVMLTVSRYNRGDIYKVISGIDIVML